MKQSVKGKRDNIHDMQPIVEQRLESSMNKSVDECLNQRIEQDMPKEAKSSISFYKEPWCICGR